MRAPVLVALLLFTGCASRKAATAQHREVMDALVAQREALAELRHALAGLESEQLALHARQDEMVREVSQGIAPPPADSEVESLADRLDGIQASLDDLRAARPAAPTDGVKPGRPDPRLVHRMTIDGASARGPATAKVTVVACSDFQCPFCARAAPTLDQLAEIYGEELRIVFKHNPLPMHPRALTAAKAAEAAGKQGKFWEMYGKLFENIKALSDADVEGYAKELKLDIKQWKVDMASTSVKDRIDADKKQAKELGATGTPAFFINGKHLSGAQPIEKFKSAIDAEIVEADKLIAAGTSRAGLYAELMAKATPGVGLGR